MASKRSSLVRGAIGCAALGVVSASVNAAPASSEPVGVTPVMQEDGGPGSPVCEGDFNDDGAINFFDMVDFIDAYLDQDPAADIMPPYGVWNFVDIQMFITRLRVGCPHP